jgi:N-acetylglutamate synthase-like GNAT family acetyltransferase
LIEFTLRPATRADAGAIRALIYEVGINPMSLDWRRFILAVNPGGEIMGCGQIKPHGDGTCELASIAVWPRFQGQGVGRAIITHLLSGATPPLYLTCRAHMQTYYEPFGFRVIEPQEMPPYFRRIWRLFRMVKPIFRREDGLLVMRWK